jgi:hypothetical protein
MTCFEKQIQEGWWVEGGLVRDMTLPCNDESLGIHKEHLYNHYTFRQNVFLNKK